MFKKGDIILPKNEVSRIDKLDGLYHPAIVWDIPFNGQRDFNGLMLTTSKPSPVFDNIAMNEEHFYNDFKITYNNSHFVNQLFYKFGSWGEFELVGRLTDEGLKFIDERLTNHTPIEFMKYIKL